MVAHDLVIDILRNKSSLEFMMKRSHSKIKSIFFFLEEIESIIVKTLSLLSKKNIGGSLYYHLFQKFVFSPNVKTVMIMLNC